MSGACEPIVDESTRRCNDDGVIVAEAGVEGEMRRALLGRMKWHSYAIGAAVLACM